MTVEMYREGKIRPAQLDLDAEPYKVVLMAVMLQLTNWKKSVEVYQSLIKEYPTMAYFNRASDNDILQMLRPLGLMRKRLAQYRRIFRIVNISGWPKNKEGLSAMPAGRYIKDCYQIFVLKDLSLVPTDKVLKAYVMQETGQTILTAALKNEDVISTTFDRKVDTNVR